MTAYSSLSGSKAEIRKEVMARRALLAAEITQADVQALHRHIQHCMARYESQEIAGYISLGSECDVQPALKMLYVKGHRLSLPVVKQKDAPLVFRRWEPGDLLQKGAYGIAYPAESKPEVVPSVLLVPLLAYDDAGYRIGYGGGYYDRTLAALRKHNPSLYAVGVAYSGQKIAAIPTEAYDEPLNAVVTEQGVQEFAPITKDNPACAS